MKTILTLVFVTALSFGTAVGGEGAPFQIDLGTALQLADADNTQIALARARVRQAEAGLAQARTLILPDVSAGASYNYHNGPLQETNGNVINVERSSAFAGLGAGAVGAGPVQVSGVALHVDIGDAYYAPLVARQNLLATEAASNAVKNQTLLAVAAAYFELVRAQGNMQIAIESRDHAADLAKTTKNFATTGEGLESDSERASVEELVRERDVAAAREQVAARSVELARLLRLKSGTQLRAKSNPEARVDWVDASRSSEGLIDQALADRPELKAGDAQIEGAQQSLKQARLSPLLPRLSVGASNGDFGGSTSSSPGSDGNRTDVSVGLVWTLDSLGFGRRAEIDERESLRDQAQLIRQELEDGIAAQVNTSLAAVRNRKSQIDVGKQAVGKARRSYELNRSRVFENQGLPIETLQAIQSLATARQLYRDAVIDYNIAQFQLYTAVGQPGE